MSLKKNIEIEIRSGRLKERFRIDDVLSLPKLKNGIKVGDDIYQESSLRTNINNFRIGPKSDEKGYHVKKGALPWFTKYDDNSFSLIEDDSDDTQVDHESHNSNEKKENISLTKDHIAHHMVAYLREKPFRILLRKPNGKWHPEDGSVTGWRQRLSKYLWPTQKSGLDWKATEEKLNSFSKRAKILLDENNKGWESLYSDIKKWGNPRGSALNEEKISYLVRYIKDNPDKDCKSVNSTLTKLYAISFPGEYVIYDSRVATAIVSIIEDIYKNEKSIKCFQNLYPDIGFIAAASGTRPRATRAQWPNAYQSEKAQSQANELIARMASVLNAAGEDGLRWDLRMVEAVLFMEGY